MLEVPLSPSLLKPGVDVVLTAVVSVTFWPSLLVEVTTAREVETTAFAIVVDVFLLVVEWKVVDVAGLEVELAGFVDDADDGVELACVEEVDDDEVGVVDVEEVDLAAADVLLVAWEDTGVDEDDELLPLGVEPGTDDELPDGRGGGVGSNARPAARTESCHVARARQRTERATMKSWTSLEEYILASRGWQWKGIDSPFNESKRWADSG